MISLEEFLEEIRPHCLDDNQIYFLYCGMMDGLDYHLYLDYRYDASQMEQLYIGLKHEVDIDVYSDYELDSSKMKIIRAALENGAFTDDMLLKFLTTRDLKQIYKINDPFDIPELNAIKRKNYYKLRYEQKKINEETGSEIISNIDFDSLLDEEDDETLDFSDFIGFEKNIETDWETLSEEEYYFKHFNNLGSNSIFSEVIGKYKLLSYEEEQMYFCRYIANKEYIINGSIKKGYENNSDVKSSYDAYIILLYSNIRLVINSAFKYVVNSIEFKDLVMEGTKGLQKAIENFDPARGFKFSTYCIWWVRQAITRYIADNERIIRIPVHMVEKLNQVDLIKKNLLSKHGEFYDEVTAEITAYKTIFGKDLDSDDIDRLQNVRKPVLSIETLLENNDLRIETAQYAYETDNVSPNEFSDRQSLKEDLDKLLDTLTDKEKIILKLRFGLDDGRARTLEEVGNMFGITRERIRQIEAKALRKLKSPSKLSKFREYIHN